jgi:glycosyltransferase involved in cell wall biosynthesis
VFLMLPARNEGPRVGAVIERVPAEVAGRPVHCLVIDDGSCDDTAGVAAAAGASVITRDSSGALGAAIRTGLASAVERGAAVVAFCDADGEYAPEDLERVVAPILEDRADYVVGSRFDGEITRMLPHRRLGNVVLTKALAFVARRPISDGQSGFRALSRAAAADAEIIHDFNYAQVLTLDLLDKGYRYAEVPITYAFRTSGRSFVRLGPYLRAVVPAVHRQVNRHGDTGSVLDDVAGEGFYGAVPPVAVVDGGYRNGGFQQGVLGVVVGEQP